MANLNNLFNKFVSDITLDTSKRESLKTSRDSLRKDIEGWFKDNDKQRPKFHGQGSFSMKTLINPINNNEYDIDDGIYIYGYENEPESNWPTTATVHSWVKNAVEDRTTAGATDKDTCIRVSYAKGYHVDLPAYILKDGEAYLAHKNKGWFVSDPKAFINWFVGKVKDENQYGEQLRRIVKCLKAWKDYTTNPLKGIEITILATQSFEKYEGHDEKSLIKTTEKIIDELENDFKCCKPVEPFEDLFEDASDARREGILSELKALVGNLQKAISEEDEKAASEILIDKAFGSRFPLGKETNKAKYAASAAPGVLKSDGRSA